MEKILVIGNGFDLAHGLVTRYHDMMDFFQTYIELYNTPCREKPYLIYNQCKTKNELIYLIFEKKGRIVDDLYNCLNNNICYELFENIFESEYGIGWLDFEKALYDRLIHHLTSEHINEYYEGMRRVAVAIDIYLSIFFQYIVPYMNITPIKKIADLRPEYIVNFNYTDTYSKYYKNKNKPEIIYVHGKADLIASIIGSKLVLGVDGDRFASEEYKRFSKEYQRKEFINLPENICEKIKINGNANELYIYGHSLSKNDASILLPLISDSRIMYVNLFYTNNPGNTKNELEIKFCNLIEPLSENDKNIVNEKLAYIQI